ncbi:MAG: adenylosuccinate synthase [Patescibacteria group bacterium]|nr:adenylosuccinate synthase [Patescibacteria group bacterium]
MTKLTDQFGQVCTILGAQWGDEGKGKLVDILAREYDIVARATGGANAGHTIYLPDNSKFIFHLVPSGILHEGKICVMGNGMVVHLQTFQEELDVLKENNIDYHGRIMISNKAHFVFDYHKKIDGIQEERKGKNKVGTTLRGIGPAYTDKIRRTGVRVGEILDFDAFTKRVKENFEMWKTLYPELEHDTDAELATLKEIQKKIAPYIIDTALYLHEQLEAGKTVLMEGANGTLLDIDHGTYPYVTSSNASIGGVLSGSGIGPKRLGEIVGIMKAYMTRVGAGPFPTEQDNEIGKHLQEKGGEFGSTTGRPRRCGWFDAVVSKYSADLNTLTSINLTKLDVLSGLETLKIAVKYTLDGKKLKYPPASLEDLAKVEVEYLEMPGWNEDLSDAKTPGDLPKNAQNYVKKVEELLDVPVKFIGVGMRRDQMIMR